MSSAPANDDDDDKIADIEIWGEEVGLSLYISQTVINLAEGHKIPFTAAGLHLAPSPPHRLAPLWPMPSAAP